MRLHAPTARRRDGRAAPTAPAGRRRAQDPAAESREDATRSRLVAAATDLFAAQGFPGTSIRDIAERAGANVAAGHYHFGSKEGLYLEVLRRQFALVRAALGELDVARSLPSRRRVDRRELARQLRTRIENMADVLLGDPPLPHAALMLREMCDPTEALPIIVREFIRPQIEEMTLLVAGLAPQVPAARRQLVVFSIIGQALFYRFTMPALFLHLGMTGYPAGFSRRIARHIAEFSLAGLATLAAGRPSPRRRRGATRRARSGGA